MSSPAVRLASLAAAALLSACAAVACTADTEGSSDVAADATIDGLADAIDAADTTVPVTCTYRCGDVNNDGRVDLQDRSALVRALGGDALPGCGAENADVLKDGALDDRDLHTLAALISGDASDGCLACAMVCGDVHEDGQVDIADLTELGTTVDQGRTPTACAFWGGDVDANGILNDDDVALLQAYTFDGGDPPVCAQ